jgi:bacteriocin biosynthesis cyclodehydratase domain-containing protein
MSLRDDERERYGRHLVIPDIGEQGQERLKRGSVLVVGTGGLGSPALFYLAAAGVGRLGIVDSDVVELSNLQRQILHATDDLGRAKTESGAATLRALNPDVTVERHQVRFDAANAGELVSAYDVVIDAVDNFGSRFLLNDACVLGRKTLVEGAILRFTGLAITIRGGETACYRCLFPREPAKEEAPTTAEAGVFGPVPGVIGAVQAAEAIKVLVGFGRPLYDRLLQVDLADMTFAEVEVARDPACPVCGERPTITDLSRDESAAASPHEKGAGPSGHETSVGEARA